MLIMNLLGAICTEMKEACAGIGEGLCCIVDALMDYLDDHPFFEEVIVSAFAVFVSIMFVLFLFAVLGEILMQAQLYVTP